VFRLISGTNSFDKAFWDGNYVTGTNGTARNGILASTLETPPRPVRGAAPAPSSTRLPFALCPSFSGQTTTTEGITNYRANAGIGPGGVIPVTTGTLQAEGGLSFRTRTGFRDYADGTSKTVMVSESRQNPTQTGSPCTWIEAGDTVHMASVNPGVLVSGSWNAATNSLLALMSGTNTTNLPPPSHTLTLNTNIATPNWGPSSDHAGKTIGHLFADGHTEFISSDVAVDIYSALNTRSGSEILREY
jgi:hypothetical protein